MRKSTKLYNLLLTKIAADNGLQIETFKGELKSDQAASKDSLQNMRSNNMPKPVSMEQEAKKQLWIRGINKLKDKNDPNKEVKEKLTPSYIMNKNAYVDFNDKQRYTDYQSRNIRRGLNEMSNAQGRGGKLWKAIKNFVANKDFRDYTLDNVSDNWGKSIKKHFPKWTQSGANYVKDMMIDGVAKHGYNVVNQLPAVAINTIEGRDIEANRAGWNGAASAAEGLATVGAGKLGVGALKALPKQLVTGTRALANQRLGSAAWNYGRASLPTIVVPTTAATAMSGINGAVAETRNILGDISKDENNVAELAKQPRANTAKKPQASRSYAAPSKNSIYAVAGLLGQNLTDPIVDKYVNKENAKRIAGKAYDAATSDVATNITDSAIDAAVGNSPVLGVAYNAGQKAKKKFTLGLDAMSLFGSIPDKFYLAREAAKDKQRYVDKAKDLYNKYNQR